MCVSGFCLLVGWQQQSNNGNIASLRGPHITNFLWDSGAMGPRSFDIVMRIIGFLWHLLHWGSRCQWHWLRLNANAIRFRFRCQFRSKRGEKKRDGNGNGGVKVEIEGRGCRACHQSCEFYRPDVCGMWFGWIFASDHEFWPMVMGTLASTTRVYCPHDLANISACAKFVICKFYLRPFHHYSPITFGISFTLVLHILFSYFVLYQHGIIAHKWPVTH